MEVVEASEPLTSPDDIKELISRCFEQGSNALLMNAVDLTPGFFDLSTGEAGTILQKLRNYRIRLAVVLHPGGPAPQITERFREMAAEERKSNHFRVCDSREEAVDWLSYEA